MRLDRFLAERFSSHSRARIQEGIKAGCVLRNGRRCRPSEAVRAGDVIRWSEPPPAEIGAGAAPEAIPLDILYEDEHLIVLDKPAGLVVHPGAGNRRGTLVSALLHHGSGLSRTGGMERPGIVHRLDKETSGCLVVAKTDAAHHRLARQFASREVAKTYLALVRGVPRHSSGTVDAPLARHAVQRKKMAVAEAGRGRPAVTEYRVLSSHAGLSLIECRPQTGRTHQIRVHLKHLGCPVVGDPLYGRRENHSRHMLHAWKLSFVHPATGQRLDFEAPPPPGFLPS